MIRKLLEERHITAYKLSKDTGIPYSTVNKLVNEVTPIGNLTVETFNRLAAYFNMTMDMIYNYKEYTKLYISNDGRTVCLSYNNEQIQYMGPKNLVRFEKINKLVNGVLYVDTIFWDENNHEYIEEDYIDLIDISNCYGLDFSKENMPMVELIKSDDNT